MNLPDRLEDLEKKEQILKTQYIKILGAIEVVNELIQGEKDKKAKK